MAALLFVNDYDCSLRLRRWCSFGGCCCCWIVRYYTWCNRIRYLLFGYWSCENAFIYFVGLKMMQCDQEGYLRITKTTLCLMACVLPKALRTSMLLMTLQTSGWTCENTRIIVSIPYNDTTAHFKSVNLHLEMCSSQKQPSSHHRSK